MEQAIVAIASRQKIAKADAATGSVISDTLKIQDKLEYVVITRPVDPKTFQKGQWRIWGTVAPTTLDQHMQDHEDLNRMNRQAFGFEGRSEKT